MERADEQHKRKLDDEASEVQTMPMVVVKKEKVDHPPQVDALKQVTPRDQEGDVDAAPSHLSLEDDVDAALLSLHRSLQANILEFDEVRIPELERKNKANNDDDDELMKEYRRLKSSVKREEDRWRFKTVCNERTKAKRSYVRTFNVSLRRGYFHGGDHIRGYYYVV